MGSDVDDPGFVQLVGELSLASERFRQLWARHDVRSFEGAALVQLDHPQVGELSLSREKLRLGGAPGQLLVIYHAETGSSSAEKLAVLASLANSTSIGAPHTVPWATTEQPRAIGIHPAPE